MTMVGASAPLKFFPGLFALASPGARRRAAITAIASATTERQEEHAIRTDLAGAG